MVKYRCNVCKVFEYDPRHGNSVTGIRPGTEVGDFPDDWKCPICSSDKSHLVPVQEEKPHHHLELETKICPFCGQEILTPVTHEEKKDLEAYLGPWRRESDALEVHMEDIHLISRTGELLVEPMRTRLPVISWNDILIRAAQIAKIPLDHDTPVTTRTVIGPEAKHPLVIETPIYVTHMSFGALSREAKIALATGSAAVQTAIGSGEGGILPEERHVAYRYIFEYVPNRYSVTDENLRDADAIEIKIGQSTSPGLGAHLPAEKVTAEIAAIRGYPEGTDIISPARYPDIRGRQDLAEKIDWLRQKSGGKPVGVKIAAGHIEADLEAVLFADPDFITIDGRPGATGSAPKFIKDATSVPTIFALHRARKFLDSHNAAGVSLVITGGLRISTDFAKALAMGADAVAIGTAALMACACQQYRVCATGKCPVGVTTQDPVLRKRLEIDISARKLELFLRVSTQELADIARLTGNTSVHALRVSDLCTVNSEISDYTDIEHV
jgi:glutamate synthase domain-containing protein 2/rubredoxin